MNKSFLSLAVAAATTLSAIAGSPIGSKHATIAGKMSAGSLKRAEYILDARSENTTTPRHNAARIAERVHKAAAATSRRASSIDPTLSFNDLQSYDYLEAPDGSAWYYTTSYTYETVDDNGYAQQIITAFRFDIYDSSYKLIGSVADKVDYAENETRAVVCSLDPTVTSKFFNSNSNYEVIVTLAMNTSAEYNYEVHYYNKVYSINGAKDADGFDTVVATVPGICVDAVNAAPDRWSENFFLTFQEDVVPDPGLDYGDDYMKFLAAYKTRVTTYKKAGYGSAPSPVNTVEIPNLNLPGDQMNSIYFISKVVDGKPYFFISQYEKSLFVDPTGFSQDESLTPDNYLLIDAYCMNSLYDSKFTKLTTTRFPSTPVETATESYTYYGIGTLGYSNDIDVEVNGSPLAPAYVVTRDIVYLKNPDDYVTSFCIYGNDGNMITTIADSVDGVISLSDVDGQPAQSLFVFLEDSGYRFDFTDIYTGQVRLSLPQSVDGEMLEAIVDRVDDGNGSYRYAFLMSFDDEDNQGNTYPRVAWVNADGSLHRIDRISAGQKVARSSVNITAAVLSPYIFDTDAGMEYMVLLSRYTGNASQTATEFLVSDGDEASLFNAEATDRGVIVSVNFSPAVGSIPASMQIVRNNYDTSAYSVDIFNLPLTRFAGGEGTAQNPYRIASVGDLQQIKANPAAHYILVNDIDAAGYRFTPIADFSGSLDGAGHTISNLSIAPGDYSLGIFASTTSNCVIRNLNFIDVNISLTAATNYAGLIVGNAISTTVENVHVHGLRASGADFEGFFGGLVGQASLQSKVISSSVEGSVNLPAADNVGGIAGSVRTGCSFSALAFSGVINAGSAVGGIVGETVSSDELFTDCHVDADITGANLVGGIIGNASRSTVTRCYVAGSLAATTPDRWNRYIAVGGIAGALRGNHGDPVAAPLIHHNIIALSALRADYDPAAVPAFNGQLATAHRVVGYTIANEAPEIVDYDSDDKPVYDPAHEAKTEENLADNYVLASLAPVDATVQPVASSVEGESVDAFSRDFLESTVGLTFGETAQDPWHVYSDSDPWLHFEASFIFNPASYNAVAGKTFNVSIRFTSRQPLTIDDVMDSFLLETDESVLEMTGQAEMNNNVLTIEMRALKEGTADIAVTVANRSAVAHVTVADAQSGVIDVVTPASALTFDGSVVAAPMADIVIYNLAGAPVARGNSAVSTATLIPGAYIAVATDAAGVRSTLKIIVR